MSQVKNQFAAKNNRLRDYRNAVWDTIEMFNAFAIQAVPREGNTLADALLVIACTFEIPDYLEEECKVEVLFRPSVPDNQDHWQVFDNDAQIIAFLHNTDNFQNCNVNLEDKVNNLSLQDVEVMKLAIPLEKNFNRHDEYRGKRVERVDEILEINIGCLVSPKMIKIGKNASPQETKSIENLIREYKDVFAWTYDDLKSFDPAIIEHTIPLNEGAKPYRQKL